MLSYNRCSMKHKHSSSNDESRSARLALGLVLAIGLTASSLVVAFFAYWLYQLHLFLPR